MISIIVAVKDYREHAGNCLSALTHSVRVLGLQPATEFIFIDDDSRADSGIAELFRSIRGSTSSPVRAIRLKQHQHYTYSVALGMSLARGDCVLFFSHDMVVAPACLAALLAHADRHAQAGVIRPVSQHMDQGRHLQVVPPLVPRTFSDVLSWSRCVAHCCAGQVVPTPVLIGDAMLITRRCIEAIGVLDTRFVGFLGDLDFGLRAQLVDFTPVVARDAWVQHYGGAAVTEAIDRQARGLTKEGRPELGMPMIHRAYEAFRQKWDPALPDDFFKLGMAEVNRLLQRPLQSLGFPLRQPPVAFDPAICEEI